MSSRSPIEPFHCRWAHLRMIQAEKRSKLEGALATVLFGSALAFAAAWWAPVSQAAERPNILFIFADDWGKYASCYAHGEKEATPNSVIKTPNIDRVAHRGVLFSHAFVNAPSCTPCRSSLLSGQYFWRTGRGAVLHGAQWDPSIPSFPLLLRDAGYHIGKAYKVWSPGVPADAPFDGQRHAFEKAGGTSGQFSEYVESQLAQGGDVESARGRMLDEVTDNFAAFLKSRPANKPFLFWFGPTNVHRKWVRGSGMKQWNIDPERLRGKLPPFLPDAPVVREDFADYMGEIQNLDAQVGRLIAELERAGALENTVVIISGDHGPPGFPNGKCNLYDFGVAVPLIIAGPGIKGGRVVEDLVSLPDLAPTALTLAGVHPPSTMTARGLGNILASAQQGRVDPERTFVLVGRERHVGDARAGNVPYPQRAIRTQDYLYIVNFEPDRWPLGDPRHLSSDVPPTQARLTENTYVTFSDVDASPTKAWLVTHQNDPSVAPYYHRAFDRRPREELYVLADDPWQMTNVAADPKRQAVRADLEQRLFAELRRSGDPRVLQSPPPYEKPPFVDPPRATQK